jgi:hypothetical protein
MVKAEAVQPAQTTTGLTPVFSLDFARKRLRPKILRENSLSTKSS